MVQDAEPSATRLIVISGPIASGKSTLAAAMAAEVRRRGLTVAVTALDAVAEMALPSLPDWAWAHTVHGHLVRAWLTTEVDLVIDEGTCSADEVRQILEEVDAGTLVQHVVLTADFARSLDRAQRDAGRGISKDPDFLRADHERYAAELPHLPCDVRVHVEDRSPLVLAVEVLDSLGV